MKQMLDDLEALVQGNGMFSVHKESWKMLCDFTHSGMRLLSQMATPTGDIQPIYKPSQLIALMEYALATWMLVVIGFLAALGKEKEFMDVTRTYKHLFPRHV